MRCGKKHDTDWQECPQCIKKYYPEILELIKGMADSAKVDYRDLIFINSLVEYSLKCSAFAATGDATKDGHPLIGMNADESKSIQKYYINICFF